MELTNAGPAGANHDETLVEAEALALRAVAWIMSDDARAGRLLAVTGLTPEGLRAAIRDPALLGAAIAFLAGHEPDLIACAEALEVSPARLAAAGAALSS